MCDGRNIPPQISFLNGHGSEADFWFFLQKLVPHTVDPIQYLSSRSNFGFEFAEIFVIQNRHPDLVTLLLGESGSRRVGESAFECLKESSASRRVANSPTLGVALVSRGVAIRPTRRVGNRFLIMNILKIRS
jgi:hypothetical protein